jgi:AmmeMemoRadiSam system protein B
MEIRRADFAGSWYPAGARECERQIQEFLADGPPALSPQAARVGGIVPHAGWFFSGKIAAQVIAALKHGPDPDVIAVLGMHLAPGNPNFIMCSGAWETPLGAIEIAEDVASRLAQGFAFHVETARRHHQDNTIELQLPFIKHVFPGARIVPLGIAPEPRSLAIGEALVDIAAHLGRTLKVLGSTDLTHYGPNYGFTPRGHGEEAHAWVREHNDPAFINKALAMDALGAMEEGLKSRNACCAGAAAVAIAAAKRLGAVRGEEIAYRTSREKSPGASFVGYAGVVF